MMSTIFLRLLTSLLFISIFHSSLSAAEPMAASTSAKALSKKFDLVLIHGLANKHRWSDEFLQACLNIWGDGRVFVVYTSREKRVTEQFINGKKVIFAGDANTAGIDSINEQVILATETIQLLEKDYGLQSPFSIIAHSMGGLVARQYSYKNPGQVAALVTLGTPHHGSPLANSFQWIGYFLDATEAIEDLKPANIEHFNQTYPAEGIPLASSSKLYTIRGTPEGTDCFGWIGELFLGWQILSTVNKTQNDGLVPHDSAVIEGAEHIGDFAHYDHNDLVIHADVAEKAAEYLP